MKRMFLGVSVVAAMLLTASSALAAGGLNFAWTDCVGDGGVQSRVNACTSNAGTASLIASFFTNSDYPGVTGIEAVVDFLIGDGVSPIPAWWQIRDTGCRSTPAALGESNTPPGTLANCADWGGGQQVGGLAGAWQTSAPGGWSIAPANEPAHRRSVLAIAVPSTGPVDLLATQEYYAFTITLSNRASVGTGSCAGCSTPACIVLNSINVVQGTASNQFLSSGVTPGSNIATYNGGAPNCLLTPAQTRTWSSVKNMYR